MATVTIDSEEVLDTDDITKWEGDVDKTSSSITDKAASTQRWIQRQLTAHGLTEAEVNDPTELEELAACRLLYLYYRDQAAIIEEEGFSSKMEEYRDECEREIELLFDRGGLTVDEGEMQAVPTKIQLISIG